MYLNKLKIKMSNLITNLSYIERNIILIILQQRLDFDVTQQ